MKTKTIQGYYGSGNTPCDIHVAYDDNPEYATCWYCVHGSLTVNLAKLKDMALGVNVELVEDFDCFTWSEEIFTEEQLLTAVEA